MKMLNRILVVLIINLLLGGAYAGTRIAILNFELNDITSLPQYFGQFTRR